MEYSRVGFVLDFINPKFKAYSSTAGQHSLYMRRSRVRVKAEFVRYLRSKNGSLVVQSPKSKLFCVWAIHFGRIFWILGINKYTISLSLGAFAKLPKMAVASSCLSVRVQHLGFRLMDFHEIIRWRLYQNPMRKFMFDWNQTKLAGTSHDDVRSLMTTTLDALMTAVAVDSTPWQ